MGRATKTRPIFIQARTYMKDSTEGAIERLTKKQTHALYLCILLDEERKGLRPSDHTPACPSAGLCVTYPLSLVPSAYPRALPVFTPYSTRPLLQFHLCSRELEMILLSWSVPYRDPSLFSCVAWLAPVICCRQSPSPPPNLPVGPAVGLHERRDRVIRRETRGS